MRWLDYRLGPYLCRFLLLFRVFSRLPAAGDEVQFLKSPKNILVIKFFGMGTILLASPALRQLKEKHKTAKITIFTLSVNRELCEMLPSIDRVICLDISSALSFIRTFIRSIFKIRKEKFDVIVNLEFLTNFSALVALLATLFKRPKIIMGFSSPSRWRNRVHNINVCFDHSRHITSIFAKMFCGPEHADFVPSFEAEKAAFLQNMDSEYMKKIVKANKELAGCNFFICVNINAGELSLHRRWPKEYFAKVINELIRMPSVAVFLIGTKKDVEYVSEFKKALVYSPKIIDVCSKTDIKELIGLLAGSNLLITNDGGPLHFADVLGLSAVSFFGPETPYLYGPLNKKGYVFYNDLYCSPCLNIYNSKVSRCRNNICLKDIKPEKVLKVIKDKYLSF